MMEHPITRNKNERQQWEGVENGDNWIRWKISKRSLQLISLFGMKSIRIHDDSSINPWRFVISNFHQPKHTSIIPTVMPTVAFCCSFNSLDIFNDCLCKFEQFCALFFCLDLYCLVYCSLIDQLDDLQYYWFLILYFRELPKNMKPTINVANIPSAITQRSCWASKKKNFVVKFSMNTVTFLLVHSWRGVRNQSSKCSREIELTVSQMTHPSQSFFRAFFDQVIINYRQHRNTPMLNLSRGSFTRPWTNRYKNSNSRVSIDCLIYYTSRDINSSET